MILAFPMWRRGFAKVCGSVIIEAERRGHQAVLLYKPDDKPGERVERSELAVFQAWGLNPDPDWAWRHYDAIIGDPSIGEMTDLPAGPRYALDFVWELRMRPSVAGVTRCWSTETQREMVTEVSRYPGRYLHGHDDRWYMNSSCGVFVPVNPPPTPDKWVGPVVGMTALDALPLVDPAIVRAKYTLGDKPILLLFALKFGGVRHFWRQTAFRWWHYARLLLALRAYADRHGYTLVAKTRAKNNDPPMLGDLADYVIEDESLWPYTSAELVKAASLVIHFQSGAVFEAAAAGVPQLSIAVPQPHLAHLGGHGMFFSTAERSLQNWLGVVQSVDYRDAPDLFREDRVWNTIIGYERNEHARRFTGPLDGKSAARVLDLVESKR